MGNRVDDIKGLWGDLRGVDCHLKKRSVIREGKKSSPFFQGRAIHLRHRNNNRKEGKLADSVIGGGKGNIGKIKAGNVVMVELVFCFLMGGVNAS